MMAVSFIDILKSIANSIRLLFIKYYQRWLARGRAKVANLNENQVEM